jgi:AraC-like DNA-binding protein
MRLPLPAELPTERDAAESAPLARLIVIPPPTDLAPLVEYVWQLVLARGESADHVWRVVADGYVDLAVRIPLDAPELRAAFASPGSEPARRAALELLASSPAVICGAATAARSLAMDQPLLVTGARFRLGAAAGALRNSPAGLVDGARPLGDVLDRRAIRDVSRARVDDAVRHAWGCGEDRLLDPESVGPVLRALARENVIAAARGLLARSAAGRGGRLPDHRVRGALRLLDETSALPADAPHEGEAQVARVGRELGVSVRTLERLFADHVGFAPRTYQRLRRAGAVAEALEREAPPEGTARAWEKAGRRAPVMLSDLAHRFGYADHAHMTREFGRIMGVTPSAYRREALESPVVRHVASLAMERSTPFGVVGRRTAA